jgi:hypothetical protein
MRWQLTNALIAENDYHAASETLTSYVALIFTVPQDTHVTSAIPEMPNAKCHIPNEFRMPKYVSNSPLQSFGIITELGRETTDSRVNMTEVL